VDTTYLSPLDEGLRAPPKQFPKALADGPQHDKVNARVWMWPVDDDRARMLLLLVPKRDRRSTAMCCRAPCVHHSQDELVPTEAALDISACRKHACEERHACFAYSNGNRVDGAWCCWRFVVGLGNWVPLVLDRTGLLLRLDWLWALGVFGSRTPRGLNRSRFRRANS